MAELFQRRSELIKLGDDAMSARNAEDALSAYLSAGVESVRRNWRRSIGHKAMSILEFDFDSDGQKEVLIGTDGGLLLVFDANGEDENVFLSSSSKKNSLMFNASVNSIDIAKNVVSNDDIIIVGSDKLYAFQYKNGELVVIDEQAIDNNEAVTQLKVFNFEGEQQIVVGDASGNVYSYKMNGIGFAKIPSFHFKAEGRIIDFAIGDVNGDEELEIVVVSEDKYIYFLSARGKQKATPFAVKHWITNVDIDKKTERLYIGEFDGTVHIYKYQKERIRRIAALKQHGIMDLLVVHLFSENSEPQFVIGTSDRTMSIFDSIDKDGDLLWTFITGAGQRAIRATLVESGILSLCVGTESCEVFKYTVCLDSVMKNKVRDAAKKKTVDQWLDYPFNREQQNVLFCCINKEPDIKAANYDALTASEMKKSDILNYHRSAMEMWWNGVEYKWASRIEGRVYAIFVMDNPNATRTVLVASQTRNLLGLKFSDGEKKWTHPCNGGVRGVCAGRFSKDSDNNFIAIATMNNSEDSSFDKQYDNSIEVLDCNRKPIWGFKNRDWALFVAADDVNDDGDFEIFVGTEDKQVLAFTSSGVLKWNKSVGDRVRAVTIAKLEENGSKVIVFGSDDRRVYLFRDDGDSLYSFPTPHYVLVVKVFDIDKDGKCEIITGNEDGFIHVYDYNGKLLWQFETGSWIAALDICVNPQTQEVEIIIGSADKSVYGINQHGMLLWQYETDARVRALSTVADDGKLNVVFGSYSDKDNVYRLSRIDQKRLYEQMLQKYLQYSDKLSEIERNLLNGKYNSRHTRAFLCLFSENEKILRKGACDSSDIVVSAAACAILRHFFSKGKMLDVLEKIFIENVNRKVSTTILCEMERLVADGCLEMESCYHFLVSTLGKGADTNEMARLTKIDIARFGYRLASSAEQLVLIADKLSPKRDKYIIDELHYIIGLLYNDKRFNPKELSENSKLKEVLRTWIDTFDSHTEYENDIKRMEAICND